jgi:phosphate transport system permease protein
MSQLPPTRSFSNWSTLPKLSRDQVFISVLFLAGFLLLALFICFNWGIFSRGLSGANPAFWFTEPDRAGRSGGISTILVSTLLILTVCIATASPISIGAAVFLAEFTSRERGWGRLVGWSLDVLAGVPSIVFGLFGNAVFCKFFGLGFSILAGGLTLACMVFPIMIRSIEESLRAVPVEFRQGAEALALSRWTLVRKILLPAAVPGFCVGLVLGIGRAIGETAALIFTSGYVDRMPSSLMDSGRALSVHIYDLSMNVPGGEPNAYRSAFVLLVLILIINSVVAFLGRRWFAEVRGAF